MNIDYSGTMLRINEKSIQLNYPIVRALSRDGVVIILVDDYEASLDEPLMGRNIFALDLSGRERWRILTPGWTWKTPTGEKRPQSWVDLYVESDGRTIRAADSKGFHWKLNPDTGDISDDIFLK